MTVHEHRIDGYQWIPIWQLLHQLYDPKVRWTLPMPPALERLSGSEENPMQNMTHGHLEDFLKAESPKVKKVVLHLSLAFWWLNLLFFYRWLHRWKGKENGLGTTIAFIVALCVFRIQLPPHNDVSLPNINNMLNLTLLPWPLQLHWQGTNWWHNDEVLGCILCSWCHFCLRPGSAVLPESYPFCLAI